MGTIKIIGFDEDGNAQRLKIRIARILDYDPVTGADKENIRDSLGVSPDATGLVRDDIGSGAGEISVNGMLGSLAFQDADSVSIDTLEVTDKLGVGVNPSGNPLEVAGTNGNFSIAADGNTANFSRNAANYIAATADTSSALAVLAKHSFQVHTGASTTERLRVDSGGNLILQKGGGAYVQLKDATAVRGAINVTTSDGLIFTTGASFTEKMRLDADGLKFNGDTAAANALDSYEEGTWTPVFAPETGSFTTMNMNVPSARYTRIGNICHIRAYIQSDSVNATGASGSLRISGLPFTAASNFMSVNIGYANNWGAAPTAGYVVSGGSLIVLTKRNTGITGAISDASVADLTTGAVSNANSFILNGAYEVA